MKLRPYLKEFLDEVSKEYELIIYTASEPIYADRMINYIEYQKKYFSYRIYREQCMKLPNKLLKPLDFLFGSRNITDTIIVDNCVSSFIINIKNGIPIKSYFGRGKDCELLHLAKYLKELSHEKDIAKRITNDFAAYFMKIRYS